MKHNFRELNIWKTSMDLVKKVYLISSQLPMDEKFGLKSQINRCSVSIPSNIAEGSGEGSGRTSDRDFTNFLNISLSSSYELETQLILVNELFEIELNEIMNDLQNLQRMIGGFKRTLKS